MAEQYIEHDDDSIGLCGALSPDGKHFCILRPETCAPASKHRGLAGSSWPKSTS